MNTAIRELNETDRAYLQECYNRLKSSQMTLGEDLGVAAWGTFCGGLLVNLVWVAFCRLVGILPSMSEWRDTPIVSYGVLLIFGSLFAYMTWEVVMRDFLRTRNHLDRLSHELRRNRIEETTATVEAVKCFQEPEHLMKIYLLLLSDGRIRVRYDYDSADVEGRGKSPRTNFPISRELRIVHFTILDEFRYEFGPTKIRKPRAKELRRPPKDWPEDETWLDISWNEADQIFSV